MTVSFAPDPNARLSKAINGLIDEALEHETAIQWPRDYLGGSRMGVECLRALGYEYFDQQMAHAQVTHLKRLEGGADDAEKFLEKRGTKFDGQVIRRFRLGHLHEPETARWLKAAGFELLTHDSRGRQFGWSVHVDGRKLGGSIDGVFVGGPPELGTVKLAYPLLFEHKIMKAEKWRAFQKDGAAKSHPQYVAQCQICMRQMEGLTGALLVGLNTDTSELHVEHIPFDPAEAERVFERGLQVVRAAKPETLPRLYGAKPTDFRCKWCDWRDECWSQPEDTKPVQGDRPPWA
jgi:hypothetical protein